MDVVATDKGMVMRFDSLHEVNKLKRKLDWLFEQAVNETVNIPYMLGFFDANIPVEKSQDTLIAIKHGKVV